MLRFEGVTRKFPNGAGVKELTFGVDPGEILALIGLNGAGKTTLMRLALEMLRPQDGHIEIFDTPLPHLPIQKWANVGAAVGTVLAYPELSTTENLQLAAALRGADPDCVTRAIETWGLEPLARRRFSQLSMGNRQRVGLAAALQHDPDLLILDEPSNSLDPASVIFLRNELTKRAESGAAILVSSHHLDEVARIADRIILMNHGRLIGELQTTGPDLERTFFERIHADDRARQTAGDAQKSRERGDRRAGLRSQL